MKAKILYKNVCQFKKNKDFPGNSYTTIAYFQIFKTIIILINWMPNKKIITKYIKKQWKQTKCNSVKNKNLMVKDAKIKVII